MKFSEVVAQTLAWLQREGRVSYRALRLEFDLNEDVLDALKEELIEVKEAAVDKDGKMLVWTGASSVSSSEFQVSSSIQSPIPSTQHPAAERRQLTVLFCDLVDSTALSAQLDPEEWREIVQAYQALGAQSIEQYAGQIAQYLGDGLLVYFGYPTAHEDDAQRAVRTGLAIVEALQQDPLLQRYSVRARISIHTGLVVVGEIGGDAKREQLALGDTPNVAARLQGLAQPNAVVMSAATQRLVAGLFECDDLGLHPIRGLSTPVQIYQARGESGVRTRFEVASRRGLTPLIGREHEVHLLLDRWEQAKTGAGQVVLLNGEPGIGKSRLVHLMKEQGTKEGAAWIEFRCAPFFQNTAFAPLIEHLQHLLQLQRTDASILKLEKLQHALSQYRFPQVDTLPLIAALLSLPAPAESPPLTLSPQKQKQRTEEVLVAWLMEEAERQAVITIWEDLHWADPSTLEFLSLLLDQVPTTRLLMVLTARPEFQSPWSRRAYSTTLTLNRLPRAQAAAMVQQVTRDKVVPAEVLQQIVAKTDGVPLFVEELTKSVIETFESKGSVESPNRTSFQFAIPSTLHDSLMARLDRLGSAKEIAQLGATIGREFRYELLHAVSPLDEATLQHGLKQLVEAELVYQRALGPQAHYIFKHALIQDTAYQSLLKSTRQQYHQQIAQTLEAGFAEMKETQPELLAHHYTEAGLIKQAIPYWQQAGERAAQRSAYVEAAAYLTKGLEVLQTLPDAPERSQQEILLQITLGPTLMAVKGWSAREVEKTYTRARELCQQVGEPLQLFRVLRGLSPFYLVRAKLRTAREVGEQLLNLAHRAQDPALLLEAHRALGQTLCNLGEFGLARSHLEKASTFYDLQQHRPHAFLYGYDPGVTGLSNTAWALWHLGYPDQAVKKIQHAITLAQALSHPFSLAYALGYSAWLQQFCQEGQQTQKQTEALTAFAYEQGFEQWLAWGTILRGWALAEQGQEEEGIVEMRRGLAAHLATGAELWQSCFLGLLGRAYGKMGRVEEGLTLMSEALTTAHRNDERFYEAELYRLKGELLLTQEGYRLQAVGHRGKTEEAEECFWKAIDVARHQQAKSLELRTTVSLARLWQQQGKQHEARTMLSEIYNWFIEGFDTKDLQEAKALLDELDH